MTSNPIEAREKLNAETRWVFAKTLIEPVLGAACNDDTALGLLPNHEFQIRNPAPALCGVKCRKIAWSWGIAATALCRAATEKNSTSIIGSYDEDESREKLNFLDWIYRAVCDKHPALLKELGMTDGMEIRRFNNGSRIRFIPRKAPTGPGASILWDEFSVEQTGRVTAAEILAGALACTTHTGTVAIGGTQRGPDTVFNQIVSGEIERKMKENPLFANMPHRTWVVGKFPWWSSPALCTEPLRALVQAPEMKTEDRVERFGNDKLKAQFVLYLTTPDLGLDIFQREFEMLVLDDKESYFDDELMQFAYDVAGPNYTFYHESAEGAKYGQYGDSLEKCKRAVDRLASDIRAKKFTGKWSFAFDVGDDRDPSEIFVGCSPTRDRELLEPRLNLSMLGMPFDGQEEMVDYVMSKIPVATGLMDATKGSLSRMLAQRLERRYGQRCAGYPFTPDSKTLLATGGKARMQAGKLALPPRTKQYSALHAQFKRVKREEKGTTVRFDAARNKDDHADKFWCLMLLCEAASHAGRWTPRRAMSGAQSRPALAPALRR